MDDDKHIHVNFGLGVFRLYPLDKTLLLGGIRVGYGQERSKYSIQTTSEVKSNRYSYSFGPFIGAEYFFGNHFSIGAEVGLWYIDRRKKAVSLDDYDYHQAYLIIDSGVLLRFYF